MVRPRGRWRADRVTRYLRSRPSGWLAAGHALALLRRAGPGGPAQTRGSAPLLLQFESTLLLPRFETAAGGSFSTVPTWRNPGSRGGIHLHDRPGSPPVRPARRTGLTAAG